MASFNIVLGQKSFDFEGHRGCRGLMPENSIAAMKKAIDLDVTTLELDVVISADHKVVVSHESFMSSTYVLDPDGNSIQKADEKSYNLYKMDYSKIKTYDSGMKPHKGFPLQKKMAAYKPLLPVMIDSVEIYARHLGKPAPHYNIEIKSSPEGDNEFHPEPQQFLNLVYAVMQDKGITGRSIVQSFDVRPLSILHEKYPHQQLAFLVANIKSIGKNIKKLGFTPDIYSPYYKLIGKKTIARAHEMDIKVIPWTVNEKEDMIKLIKSGVDGLISDYPNLYSEPDIQALVRVKTSPGERSR
jgi:glycerophosphoryl diester phosphodiesterase